MTDPERPVTISFTVQEANELAYAAEQGVDKAYVMRDQVHASIKRLRDLALEAEKEGNV